MTSIETRPDGRSARSARTRASVVEALLGLIDEGDLRPTARAIAERAGVSERSVYVHFDDLEDLFAAASAHRIDHVRERMVPLDPALPLPERLELVLETATTTLETTLAVRRAATLHEPFSPTLAATLAAVRDATRSALQQAFAPELDALDAPTRRRRVSALMVATSSYTWETLRLHEELDASTAGVVLRDLVTQAVGGEP